MLNASSLSGVLVLIMAAGCGSTSGHPATDGGRDGDSSAGPSIAQACSDIAQAQCAKRMSCSGGASLTRAFGTMANCVARETLSCMNGLSAPQTGNSPALVENCVAAFPNYSCADFFNNNPPAVCAPTGPRGAGMACAFNGQCASGYCSRVKNASCGTCAPAPSAGVSCLSSNCGHDQTCVAATQMCQVYGALNAPCDEHDPCGDGLTCVGAVASTSTPGTCQTAATVGGTTCGGTMPGCDGTMGLFCGGTSGSKSCTTMTYVGDGMPCGALSSTSRAECTAGGCYTSTGLASATEMGTCKADAADGAACDTALGPACLAPARCVTTGDASIGSCLVPVGSTCG